MLSRSPFFNLPKSPLLSFAKEPTAQELRVYRQEIALLIPISFYTKNTSQTVALDVRAVIDIPKLDELTIVEEKDLPQNPTSGIAQIFDMNSHLHVSPGLSINDLSDKWVVEVAFGKIQPHAEEWVHDVFYIGSKINLNVDMRARLYADNLPQPIETPLAIYIKPKEEIYNSDNWK